MLIGCFRTYVLLHKTMKAGSRANEEQPGQYKIDRYGVVSKYVGETEKRLNNVFLKVWPNNLMLFFGEANVDFGKPSMAKNTHHRYGNRHERRTLV